MAFNPRRRIPTLRPISIGELTIESKPATKYLGLMLDSKMSFFEQIKATADRAAAGVAALSRLMANVGGPISTRRRLLMGVTQSVLLYGAEVWADALVARQDSRHSKFISNVANASGQMTPPAPSTQFRSRHRSGDQSAITWGK